VRKELERDEGLARLSRGTRWLTAGAFLSAGCLSVAVAETLPGRSSAATHQPPPTTPATTTPPATTPITGPPPSTTAPGDDAQTPSPQTQAPQTLAPPTTPPTTAYNPPVVVSGGS
jgi:hypothetical protein